MASDLFLPLYKPRVGRDIGRARLFLASIIIGVTAYFAALVVAAGVVSGDTIEQILTSTAVLIAIMGIYLGPSLLACGRRHRRAVAIFMLDLTWGWTLVGWVAALVWACSSNRE